MSNTRGNYVAGSWEAGEGEPLVSYSAQDGSPLFSCHSASRSQIEKAVNSAAKAFETWRQISLSERAAFLFRYVSELESCAAGLAQLIHLENGKHYTEAEAEVKAMIAKLAISEQAYELRTPTRGVAEGQRLCHKPHGVIAVFSPFNFPGHLANGHMIPALLAGNTVVLKPSELTPAVACLMIRCFEKAGFPAGVVSLVQGAKDVGEALCAAQIQGLCFTGSSKTGYAIHKQFGGRPDVILALEMGGNNALIIGSQPLINGETDLKAVVDLIKQSAWASSGQRCTCTRRLLLVDTPQNRYLADALVDDIQAANFEARELAPLITPQAAETVLLAQSQLESLGGKVLVRAARTSNTSGAITPSLIDMSGFSVSDCELLDEEVFGPLLQIFFVSTLEQAILEANSSRYGLAAGLVSQNTSEQELFVKEIRAGIVSVNKPTAGASSQMPFGGIGASGNHRPSALYAADYCAWPQSILYQ